MIRCCKADRGVSVRAVGAQVRMVKAWAGARAVNDATNGTFNSYALTLLVSYLQSFPFLVLQSSRGQLASDISEDSSQRMATSFDHPIQFLLSQRAVAPFQPCGIKSR